ALIDSGVWARMSGAARTLYPVLLRFSDRNFKPVYPGTKRLLELTGFKQKASLRRARAELVDLGLITLATGSGRTNTRYHFCFDGVATAPPTGSAERPSVGLAEPLPGVFAGLPGGSLEDPPYNQIQ